MQKNLPDHNRSFRRQIVVLLSCIYYCLALATTAAAGQGNGLESAYNQAKEYHRQIVGNSAMSSDRQNWLAAVKKFRSIYQADQSHRLAPASLFMIARIYHEMYSHFKNPLDLGESVAYYEDIVSLFNKNRLADDALFAIANIHLNDRKDGKKAARFLKKLLQMYPEGDMASAATASLAKLGDDNEKGPHILKAGQIKTRVKVSLPPPPPVNTKSSSRAELKPIRHWSNKNYTRVVIETSAPVTYRENLLKKTENAPRRLYIDLENCRIAPELQDPIPIDDGLLKRVRSGQYTPTDARIVLDTQSLSDYKIFSLFDPFRIVIDVMGQKAGDDPGAISKPSPASAKIMPAEAPEKLFLEPSTVILAAADKETIANQPQVKDNSPPKETAQTVFTTVNPSTVRRPFDGIPKDAATAVAEDLAQSTLEASAKIPVGSSKGRTGSVPSLAQQLGLGIRRIILDPGHGGKDSGARGKNGLMEKDIVLKVAHQVARSLKEKLDCEVIMTRETDVFIPLEERTAIANTKEGDLFVSIHVNAAPSKKARGIETYILDLARDQDAMELAARENSSSASQISDLQTILLDLIQNSKKSESIRLAERVQENIVAGLSPSYKVKDLGVKQAPFIVLLGAQMPAILTEIAFISNPSEARWLASNEYIEQVSDHLVSGISSYVSELNLAYLNIR